MKTKEECLSESTNQGTNFTIGAVYEAMVNFSNQFKVIRTTSGEEIEFDDEDYWVLRNNTLFVDNNRGIVMTTYNKSVANHTGIPIAKVILNIQGKAVIKYKDNNPFNVKKQNLEIINHQKAHFKQKKPKNNTSGYKGVSYKKEAKRYEVSIKVEGKKKHLGYSLDVHSAGLMYNEAAIKYYGKDYAHLNKIERTKTE